MEQKAVQLRQGEFRSWVVAGIFTTFVSLLVGVQSVQAQSEVPMTIRFGGTEAAGGFVLMNITVPNQNTTQSTADGQMRLYDRHVAKMFEVTNFLCQQVGSEGAIKGYEWLYRGANGKSNLGRFRISCDLARNLATGYGIGKPQQTQIARESEGGPPETDVYSIPSFNIAGPKIQKWMDFVKKFPSISNKLL